MKKKILFLCAHGIEDGGCRYRIYQFVPYLQKAQFECSVRSFSTSALFRALRNNGKWITKLFHTVFCACRRMLHLLLVTRYDFVVIHREVFPFFIPFFEKFVMWMHPHVWFSFDDAVHSGHGNGESLNHPFLYRLKY